MQDFRQLQVWRKSHALALSIYRATATFPDPERYGLTAQMRRCAASIPANIAEGCGRGGNTELRQFLYISAGSASELQYFVILSGDLGLFTPKQSENFETAAVDVRRMLARLIERVGAHCP